MSRTLPLKFILGLPFFELEVIYREFLAWMQLKLRSDEKTPPDGSGGVKKGREYARLNFPEQDHGL